MGSKDVAVNLDYRNLWSSFKLLNKVIINAIHSKSTEHVYELDALLQKHKSDFMSLYKNPPRNPLHREVVIKSAKDGISIVQQQSSSKTVIPQDMVDEALLMSQMFDLNELSALELIITGQHQEPRYPGASRGPVAVMLYYDSRRSLLTALKLLIQGTNGRTWSMGLHRDVNKLLTNFINELRQEGVVTKALDYISKFDVKAEFDLLQRNRALGPGKYKKQVYDLIKDIRELYADIVFSFAAQSSFKPSETEKLISLIATRSELDSNGSLERISTTLLMALLHILDVSILQTCDECDPIVKTIPVVSQKTLLPDIMRLKKSSGFALQSIEAIVTFVCGLTARTLVMFPANNSDLDSMDFEEEKLIDEAIDKKAFEAMHKLLAGNANVYDDEFFFRRLHVIVTDFIVLFPLKVKELRDKGDETGRIVAAHMAEGIHPSATLSRNFEKFLYLMAEFYSHDSFDLSKDIWKSATEEKHIIPKYLAVNKFIRSSLDSYLPQIIHVPLLKLLTAFARSSPFNVFSLLKSGGTLSQNFQFSFDQFFSMYLQYYNAFRGVEKNALLSSGSLGNTQNFSLINLPSVNVTTTEVDILCAILELVEAIVENDRTCCLAIAENQQYACIPTLIGLLQCPVPRKIKSAILSCLGGFAKSAPSVALTVWLRLDVLLPKPQVAVSRFASVQQQRGWQNGICIEIEDIEARNEEYPITIGFLKVLNNLFQHIICNREAQQQASIESVTNFVVNAILLKIDSRIFKREEEKWTLTASCLEMLFQILTIYDPLTDGSTFKSSFALMSLMLQENLLLRCVMRVIENVVNVFEPDSTTGTIANPRLSPLMERCLLLSLKLINCVAEKEADFVGLIHAIPGFPSASLMKIGLLFCNINPRTGEIDRMASLVRVISLPFVPVQVEAMKLLRNLNASENTVSQQTLLQLHSYRKYHEDYLTHGFVECLESDETELRLEVLRMLLSFLKTDSLRIGFYGFSHRLLGFDKRKRTLRTPGSFDQSFNCFHSIIGLLEADPENIGSEERCLCMQIIHSLCVDPDTRDTVLRFIRTSYDLLTNYLAVLSRKRSTFKDDSGISEVGWFWRILATELKATSDSSLKSHCNAYTKLLVGETGNKKLVELIPQSVFIHNHPVMPTWEFFELKELWKTISDCSSSDGGIDVKVLHQRLLNEVKLFGPQLGVVQTGLVQNEIKQILVFATSLNSSKQSLNQKLNYFEGWREMVETIILTPCLEVFEDAIKMKVLLEIVHELLEIASSPETIVSLSTPISSVVVIAASNMRLNKPEVVSKTNLIATAKAITSLLEASSSAELWSHYKRARVNFYAALLHIYRILPRSWSNDLKVDYRMLKKLCKDVLSGQELVRVLAISVLNENNLSWVNDLASDGSLRLLIESLVIDDREIKASKCEVQSKAFYSFDSKMALMVKISSSPVGARILIHLGIIDVISVLECIDLYPYLINQNEVCYTVFKNVLRLMVTLCDTALHQDSEQLSRFITSRSSIIYDLLRMTSSLRNSDEGRSILGLITALVSQLISFAHPQVQKMFIGSINSFVDRISLPEAQILTNALKGCVKMSRNNAFSPLFAPSWDTRGAFISVGQPSLGTLVAIVDSSVEQTNQSDLFTIIIESCLYLMWHHLNLYFTIMEVPNEAKGDIDKLRTQSSDIVSDQFFSKIQNHVSGNTFVDALTRRIKRIVRIRSTSSFGN